MPKPLLPDRLEYLLRDNTRTTGRLAGGAALLEIGDPTGPPVVTGLTLTSSVRRNAFGRDVAEVTAVWDAVPFDTSENADPQAAPVRDYLTAISTNGNTNYAADKATEGTAAVFHNLPVGITVFVRVKARTTAGVSGPYTTASISTASDAIAPPAPSTPTLEGVLKGIRIKWDGLFAGGAPAPTDLKWLEVHVAKTAAEAVDADPSSLVGTMAPGDRVYTYPTPDYGTYHVALRGVDQSDNKGPFSGVASGKGDQAVSDDLAETIKVEAAAYGTFGGGNGVSNSGFESKAPSGRDSNGNATGGGPDPFREWTQVSSASAVGNGYKKSATAARLDRSSGQTARIDSNTIPVSETGGCVASAFVRLNSAGLTPRVEVFAVDGGSSPIAKAADDQPIPPLDPNLVGEWQRIALAYSSKRRADVRVRVALDSGPNGTVDVDAVQYEEGDYLTAYAPKPAEITPGSIGNTEITPNSVSSEKIIAGAVVAGKVQAGAIGADEIRAGSITAQNAHLENSVVVNQKVRNAAIDNLKVGEGVLTSAHISELTAERISTGVLRASTTIIAGNPGGNRVEISGAGIRLIQNGTATVDLNVGSGSGYFRGTIEASQIIGSSVQTGTSAPYVRLNNNADRGRVEFISNNFDGTGDYVSGKIVAIAHGVQILGQNRDGTRGRVVIGTGHEERALMLARRVSRFDTCLRAGKVAVNIAAGGTDVAWPGGSFPTGVVPDIVSVECLDAGGPVSCQISNISGSGFRVTLAQGATRVAATRELQISAEAILFGD